MDIGHGADVKANSNIDTIGWQQVFPYPERPFVRHRREAEEPVRFARVSPPGPCQTKVSISIPTLDADRGGCLPRLLGQIEEQTFTDKVAFRKTVKSLIRTPASWTTLEDREQRP